MGQWGRCATPVCSAFLLNFSDLLDAMFNGRSHGLMHRVGIRSFDKVGLPAVAAQQAFQLFVADARQKCWIVDFVSVQVKDRQDGAIANRDSGIC